MKNIIYKILKCTFIFLFITLPLSAKYLDVKLGGAWPADLKNAFRGEATIGAEFDEVVSLNLSGNYISDQFEDKVTYKNSLGVPTTLVNASQTFHDVLTLVGLRISIPVTIADRFHPYAQIGAGANILFHKITTSDAIETEQKINEVVPYFGWAIELKAGVSMRLGQKTRLIIEPSYLIGTVANSDTDSSVVSRFNLHGFSIQGGIGFEL